MLVGFLRSYPYFIAFVSTLVAICNQNKLLAYFAIYFITCSSTLTPALKNISKILYSNQKSFPLLGMGRRPIGAKHCNGFVDEHNMGVSTSFGMPSGHSLSSMIISIFWSRYMLEQFRSSMLRNVGLVLLNAWSLMVCASRVYLNCHTIQHVIVGGVIGTLLGYYGYDGWKWIERKHKASRPLEPHPDV
jgi:membrane-associated phospholipid phosphatase